MKGIFRSVLALGSILLASGVLAGNYDRFYIGAGLGFAGLTDKERTNNPINDRHDLGAAGVIGGGLIGYDFTLHDPFKLGIEGFANATDLNIADKQNYPPITSYMVDMRYNAGLRLLPGYEITPYTVGHIVLGYSLAKFKINDNGDYGFVSSDFRENGLQLGLGMITSLFNNFDIRADILYTTYSSQSSQGITTNFPATIQTYRNELSTLEGNLALIYKFC